MHLIRQTLIIPVVNLKLNLTWLEALEWGQNNPCLE